MQLGGLPPEYRNRIETLPAGPVAVPDLESLLENDSVVEVWVPFPRDGLVLEMGNCLAHDDAIYKFWVETEEQYQSFKHVDPLMDEEAWYADAPFEKSELTEGAEMSFDSFAPLSQSDEQSDSNSDEPS
jgi:hypothetical protein